jgi:hypothetical protein
VAYTHLPLMASPMFPHGEWRFFGSGGYSTMNAVNGWTIGDRVHWKSSARKVS